MKSTRIGSRISLIACIALLLAMSLFWLISSYHTRQVLQAQADQLGPTIARQAAELLAEHVEAEDLISINVILEELAADPAVIEASLLDEQGQSVAVAGNPNTVSPIALLTRPMLREEYYTRSIQFFGADQGAVSVALDLGYLQATLNDNLLLVGGATLIMLLVTWIFLAIYCQVALGFPLNLLGWSLGKIRRGEIAECPEPTGHDEVANLTRQYNATARFLSRNTFLDPFNEESREPDSPEGQAADLSVLIIRMSNYFSLSTAMGRKQVLQLLDRYYVLAGQVGRIYNGRVCYCHEEEILIAFHRSAASEEQAYYAICAGLLFLRLIPHLNKFPGVAGASFGLVAHSGKLEARLYSPISGANDSLIGEAPDQARRICNDCPDNALLLSPECYQLAGADSRINAEAFNDPDAEDPALIALAPPEELDELLNLQASRLAAR